MSSKDIQAAYKQRLKWRCENDLIFFARYIFKTVYNKRFEPNVHHHEIAAALKKVETGEYPNLVINIAPRHSKTEIVVKMWMAQTFARNHQAQFIHTSYSDDLALDNSSAVREIIQSKPFQDLWPTEIDNSTAAKKLWRIKNGGGVRSAASGGAITGFGAGVMGYQHGDLFAGACVIDDPLKPDAAYSKTERDKVNNRLANTIKSRRNSPHTPIVIVMQRLHADDPTGFVLSGALGIDFHHLKIKTLADDGTALWPLIITAPELIRMREADRYTFASQYQQEPTPAEGGLIKIEWFRRYRVLPAAYDMIIQSWDTASKGAEHNDPSVCTVWGIVGNQYYLLDVYRQRVEYPALKRAVVAMADKWNPHTVLIEDKSSGQSLIQDLRNETRLPIVAQMPEGDKITRVMRVSSMVESGACFLPDSAPWLIDYENELALFPNIGHDDQCLIAGTKIKTICGTKNIEDIVAGDKVLTPFGFQRVTASGCTGVKPIVSAVNLTGTGGHPVFTIDSGFKRLDTITQLNNLLEHNLCGWIKIILLKSLSSAEFFTEEWAGAKDITYHNQKQMLAEKTRRGCMLLFGSIILDALCRRDTKLITRMAIHSTACLKILSAYLLNCTGNYLKNLINREQSKILKTLGIWQRLGIKAKRAWLGIKNTPTTACTKIHSESKENALIVAMSSPPSIEHQSTAIINAEANIDGRTKNCIHGEPVYNLTVANAKCYFANGVLVHNCDSTSQFLNYMKGKANAARPQSRLLR